MMVVELSAIVTASAAAKVTIVGSVCDLVTVAEGLLYHKRHSFCLRRKLFRYNVYEIVSSSPSYVHASGKYFLYYSGQSQVGIRKLFIIRNEHFGPH